MNTDEIVLAIKFYAINLVDADLLNRYPLISKLNTLDAIQNFSKIALLRATLFCQQEYFETRLNELIDSQQRILEVPEFNKLWDSLTEFQNYNYRPEQILAMVQKFNCSPQFVLCSMCAEWMYRWLTRNDTRLDSSYALEILSTRILSFQLTFNS